MKIAKEEGVDPGTISVWFHKLGVTIGSGHHFIKQPPLRLPDNLIGVLGKGPSHVLAMVKEGIWEVQYTELGTEQLQKYCRFLTEYNQGKGVKEIAANLEVHRSTVLKWRSGTDMPYIAKLANVLTTNRPREGCKLLPMSLGAGGNIVEHWI